MESLPSTVGFKPTAVTGKIFKSAILTIWQCEPLPVILVDKGFHLNICLLKIPLGNSGFQ
jgi:hypothetical protein